MNFAFKVIGKFCGYCVVIALTEPTLYTKIRHTVFNKSFFIHLTRILHFFVNIMVTYLTQVLPGNQI